MLTCLFYLLSRLSVLYFRALEDTIEDLEAMRTMDDEILETQKEAERDLRNELDSAHCRNNEVTVV